MARHGLLVSVDETQEGLLESFGAYWGTLLWGCVTDNQTIFRLGMILQEWLLVVDICYSLL